MKIKQIFLQFNVQKDSSESWTNMMDNVLTNAKDGHYGDYTFHLNEPMSSIQIGVMVGNLCDKMSEELGCSASYKDVHLNSCSESIDINYAKYNIQLTFND